MSRTVRAFNTANLVMLNEKAVRSKRNRSLSQEVISNIDPNGWHLIVSTMIHNDSEVRLSLLVKIKESNEPFSADIDVSFKEYNEYADMLEIG